MQYLLGINCPFCSASVFLLLVLSRVEQLPSATQAAADRHSSSEQPGGALPPAELLDPGEIQVSSPRMRLLPLYSDPTTTTTNFSTLVHLFVQQPGGVSGRVCRHCQGGPDQEAPRHVGTTHA